MNTDTAIDYVALDTDYIEVPCSFSTITMAGVMAFGLTFPHGYNTAILNAFEPTVSAYFDGIIPGNSMTNSTINTWPKTILWTVSTSLYPLGGIAGALTFPFLANSIGRKWACYVSFVFAIISTACYGMLWIYERFPYFLLGRFVSGVACGAGSSLALLYLGESMPIKMRDVALAANQIAMYLGILIVLALDFVYKDTSANKKRFFYFALMSNSVPGLVCALCLHLFPESAFFMLLKRLEMNKSREPEVIEIYEDEQNTRSRKYILPSSVHSMKFREILHMAGHRHSILILCVVHATQHVSTLLVFLSYGRYILNFLYWNSSWPIVAISAGLAAATGVFIVLNNIGIGHRRLMMLSLAGTVISQCALLAMFNIFSWRATTPAEHLHENLHVNRELMPLICASLGVLLMVVAHGCALGPIPCFLHRKICVYQVRLVAISLACCTNWSFNFLITALYLLFQKLIDFWATGPFLFMTVVMGVFLWRNLPETRFLPVHDISDSIQRSFPSQQTAAAANSSLDSRWALRQRDIWNTKSMTASYSSESDN